MRMISGSEAHLRSEIYQDAVTILKTRGWTQRRLVRPDGSRCLMGAVQYGLLANVSEEDLDVFVPDAFYNDLLRKIKEVTGNQWGRVAAFNDVPWRRQRTVVRVLQELSTEYQQIWLQQERKRLTARVAQLEDQVAKLRQRVALLESENRSLFRGLLDQRNLKADQETLVALDRELNQTMADLLVLAE